MIGTSILRSSALLLAFMALMTNALTPPVNAQNSEVITACANKPGLCVIIGVDDTKTAQLACALAKDGNRLVHGIALDGKSVKNTRDIIANNKLDGLVSVESLSITPLPYRDNLVNILLVPDLEKAKKAGYSEKEARRVLAPFGKLVVMENGKTTVTENPVSKGMDEWTHNMHGPDGNRASKDTVVSYPFGYRWHGGLPFNIDNKKRHGNRYSSTRGLAIANGRCFTFSDSVVDNLLPAYSLGQALDQYVTCRDAFSGLLLWRKKIGNVYYGGLWHLNLAPFAAVGDFVYTASEDGKLLMIDAATGKTVKTLDTKFAPGRLLVDNGVLVTANWKDGTSIGESKVNRYERIRMHSGVEEGNIEAFDAKTGEKLWARTGLATSICSADGRVYLVQREGKDILEESLRILPRNSKIQKPKNPERANQVVVALDLKTGKELWQVGAKEIAPKTYKKDYLRVECAGLNDVAVVQAVSRCHTVSILNGKDGKVILSVKTGQLPLFFDGAIHLNGNKYDPVTGKVLGKTGASVYSTVCTPSYFVNDMIVKNRVGGFAINGKNVNYGGTRGSCGLGSAPAYGAFYTPQNWCLCEPSQVSGFICFGSANIPSVEELKNVSPVIKGEAFDTKLAPQATPATTWPMARYEAERNSATPANAPTKLDVIWNTSIPTPKNDTLIASSWQEYLNAPLTAPTIADGIVTLSVMDANKIVALTENDGKIKWTFPVGSRVESPPTLYRGICLFGAHDGYVYALDAQSGQLRWKARMAPNDERMVSYGKVESPWPVIGSVMVSDGVAYASAGRSQGSDGGVIVRAFSPETGKVIWSEVVAPNVKNTRAMRRNDFIFKVGDAIQIMLTRFNAKTGAEVSNTTNEYYEYNRFLGQLKRSVTIWKQAIEAKQGNIEVLKKRLASDEKKLSELKEPEGEIAMSIGRNGSGSEGLVNWNWPRLGGRKYCQTTYGNLGGNLLSWDAKSICALLGEGTIDFYSIDKIGDPKTKLTQKSNWKKSLPRSYQATSMILCDNAVATSGGIYNSQKPEEVKGFVYLFNRENGEKIAEYTLPAAVAYDGMAIVNDKICVSLEDGTVWMLGIK